MGAILVPEIDAPNLACVWLARVGGLCLRRLAPFLPIPLKLKAARVQNCHMTEYMNKVQLSMLNCPDILPSLMFV